MAQGSLIQGLPVKRKLINATTDPLTVATYYDIFTAASSKNARVLEIFNSTGSILSLAIGAAGAETDMLFYVVPGGNGIIQCLINQGMRISVTAVDANATTGFIIVNAYL